MPLFFYRCLTMFLSSTDDIFLALSVWCLLLSKTVVSFFGKFQMVVPAVANVMALTDFHLNFSFRIASFPPIHCTLAFMLIKCSLKLRGDILSCLNTRVLQHHWATRDTCWTSSNKFAHLENRWVQTKGGYSIF